MITFFLKNKFACLFIFALSLTGCEEPEKITSSIPPPEEPQGEPQSPGFIPEPIRFTHPGILNSLSNLDQIASENNERRLTGYNQVWDIIENRIPYPTTFPDIVYTRTPPYETTPSEHRMRRDAILAYAHTLIWARTGDMQHAGKAKAILNGWANHFSKIKTCERTDDPAATGCPQEHSACSQNSEKCVYPIDSSGESLKASWTAPNFAVTAELLRHYKINDSGSGWGASEITAFENFLEGLNQNYIDDLVTGIIRNPNSGWASNNWGTSAAWAQIAIGVFLEDEEIFQKGKQAFTKDNGLLDNIIKPQSGEVNECTRNCIYPQYNLTSLTYAAETLRIQGDSSLYNLDSRRLKTGWEWMAQSFLGPVSCQTSSISCAGTDIWPGVEVAYNYYKAGSINRLRQRQDFSTGGVTHLFAGFTHYTHFDTGPFWGLSVQKIDKNTVEIGWETHTDDLIDIEFYKSEGNFTGNPWTSSVTMWQPPIEAQDKKYRINFSNDSERRKGTWQFRIAYQKYHSKPVSITF